jgi:hypothetical protein
VGIQPHDTTIIVIETGKYTVAGDAGPSEHHRQLAGRMGGTDTCGNDLVHRSRRTCGVPKRFASRNGFRPDSATASGEQIGSPGLDEAAWSRRRRMPIISGVVWNLDQAVVHAN